MSRFNVWIDVRVTVPGSAAGVVTNLVMRTLEIRWAGLLGTREDEVTASAATPGGQHFAATSEPWEAYRVGTGSA
jgi:hypothetical protein